MSEEPIVPKIPTEEAGRKALAILISDIDPSLELACLNPQTSALHLKIEELERHALAPDYALARIWLETTTQKSILLRQRNRLIPINSLPTELLVSILESIVSPVWQGLFSAGVNTGIKTLHQLAMVCKRWSQVIKDTPQLWTAIGHGSKQEMELKIRKSGALPLFLHAPDTSGQITAARVNAMSKGTMEFLPLAQTESHRWKSAALICLYDDAVYKVLIDPTRTPIMESFAVGHDPRSPTSALLPYYFYPPMIRYPFFNTITPMSWGIVPPSLERFQLSEATYPSPQIIRQSS